MPVALSGPLQEEQRDVEIIERRRWLHELVPEREHHEWVDGGERERGDPLASRIRRGGEMTRL